MPGLAQLGLVRTKGFSSWLTRVVTQSNWNHIILYEGNDTVISCDPAGVEELPITAFPGAVWSHFPLELQQTAQIINFARAQLGRPYDQVLFLWCGVARLFGVKHTPAWIQARLNSQKSWICSQICDAAYQAGGMHLFKDHRVEGAVVPADYAPIWEANGWLGNLK